MLCSGSLFWLHQEEPTAPAAAAGGQPQEGGEPNPANVNLQEENGEEGGRDDVGNGDIRIVQKEVPSAVFGSAKEALAKEQAAAAAGGGGDKGKGGGMGALQRLKAAGGGGGGLGSK